MLAITKKNCLLACLFICLLGSQSKADDKIGKFIVNGVEFHIPREYLWQGRNQPDGQATDNALYLLMKWPDLSPGSLTSRDDVIKVNLEIGGKSSTPFKDGKYWSRSLLTYASFARILKGEVNKEFYIDADPLLIFENYQGLDYYKLPRAGTSNALHKDYFIVGSPLKPEKWIECRKIYCIGKIDISEDVMLDIGFRRSYLKHHNKIYEEIIKKVQSFIVKN